MDHIRNVAQVVNCLGGLGHFWDRKVLREAAERVLRRAGCTVSRDHEVRYRWPGACSAMAPVCSKIGLWVSYRGVNYAIEFDRVRPRARSIVRLGVANAVGIIVLRKGTRGVRLPSSDRRYFVVGLGSVYG